MPYGPNPTMTSTNIDARRRNGLWIWVLAAGGSVALHGACVGLVVMSLQDDLDEVELGAPGMEIQLVLAAPRTEPRDLPPGPDIDASPVAVPEEEAIQRNQWLKAESTEISDPDRFATPDDRRPKNLDNTPSRATPFDLSVAAAPTAIPHPDSAEESARSVTRALGTGDSVARARATWEKELAAHFKKCKRYPSDRSDQAADLIVTFELDRTGRILSARIVKASGDASFDEAGLAMLRRADPVPPPPESVADKGLTFTMPINFRGRS
jgi:periplasmic protein TonB